MEPRDSIDGLQTRADEQNYCMMRLPAQPDSVFDLGIRIGVVMIGADGLLCECRTNTSVFLADIFGSLEE